MSSEILSQPDFDARLADGELSLTLIGMSNVGKSHWSGRLADEAGFDRVDQDTLIEAELATALRDAGYGGGIADVAKWMGQPYEPQSAANQQKYLNLETLMLRQTIDRIANPPLHGNLVVDTTGSVVYTDEAIRKELAVHSTIVYLEATDDVRQELIKDYFDRPKPVIWGDAYTQGEGETTDQALARSYPRLLARRAFLYGEMAQVTVSGKVSRSLANTDQFLEYVRDGLPAAYANSANYTPRN